MVGTPDRIYGIGIEPSDQANDKMLPITDLGNSADIEHDDTTGFIYWIESDVSERIILCFFEDTFNLTKIKKTNNNSSVLRFV